MADAGNIIDLEDVGTAIMAAKMKVLPQTVKVYTGKLNTMKKYLREGGRHVYLDNDGNIIVPLPLEVIKGLFGWKLFQIPTWLNRDIEKGSLPNKLTAAIEMEIII